MILDTLHNALLSLKEMEQLSNWIEISLNLFWSTAQWRHQGGGARGDFAPPPKKKLILAPQKSFADVLLCPNFQRPQPENQKATVESALKIYFLYKDFQNFLKFRGASPPNPLLFIKGYPNENIYFLPTIYTKVLLAKDSSIRQEDILEITVCNGKYRTFLSNLLIYWFQKVSIPCNFLSKIYNEVRFQLGF